MNRWQIRSRDIPGEKPHEEKISSNRTIYHSSMKIAQCNFPQQAAHGYQSP
jgi:hypothetical protein